MEVIQGVIVEKVAPSGAHADAQSSLADLLKSPFQRGRGGPGGWWIFTEPTIELSTHDVYLPDAAGWRREHVPQRPIEHPIRARPDCVCEVLSPSNAVNDLGAKLVSYHRAGVPHYWIVDPMDERLTVYGWTEPGYAELLVAGRDDTVHAPPFDAIAIAVAELFGG